MPEKEERFEPMETVYLVTPCIVGKGQNMLQSGKHLEMVLRAGVGAQHGIVAFPTHDLDADMLQACVIQPLRNSKSCGVRRKAFEPVFFCAALKRRELCGREMASRVAQSEGMIELAPDDIRLFNRCLDIKRSLALCFHLQKIADLIYFCAMAPDGDDTLLKTLISEQMELKRLIAHLHHDTRFELSLQVYSFVFDRYYQSKHLIFNRLAG